MEKKCLHCGLHFTTNRSNKKYCTTNCKQMAYFMRNGMVLAGNAGGPLKVVKPDVFIPNVKDGLHSEKAETVKYVSQNESVKYESEKPNVKSISSVSENEKSIEQLFDRLIASIESRFNAALEKAKKDMNDKYEAFVKANRLSQRNEGAINGVEVPKINYCSPCKTLAVKYVSEKPEEKNTASEKADFTLNEIEKEKEASVIVFPQMHSPISLEGSSDQSHITDATPEHKVNALPLMDEEDEVSEEALAELERNEGLCNEEDEDNEEDFEEDEEIDEEESLDDMDSDNEEEDESSVSEERGNELERKLEEYKSAKEVSTATTFKKNEPEKEYKYVQSRIIRKIEKHYDKIDRAYLHHDIYRGDLEIMRAASWLNVRLRCLLESLVKLTNYSEIDYSTLYCITDAFIKLAKSNVYQIIPIEKYEHKELIKELCIKLHNMLRKTTSNQPLKFKLPPELKGQVIAVRRELKGYTQPIKFTEIDFTEDLGIAQNSEISSKKNKVSGWQERYRKMKREEQRNAA